MEQSMSADMGLVEDKQLIGGCHGFLTKNNNARNLCGAFINNGKKFFDVLSRYDDLCTYVLARDDKNAATTVKMMLPFLVSFGASDLDAYNFSKKDLILLDGAKESINYIHGTLPTFISTGSLEHHMMSVCDETGFPMTNVGCARNSIDDLDIGKHERRLLRGMADKISSMELSDARYIYTETRSLDDPDVEIISTLDEIFLEQIPKMSFYNEYTKFESVGMNEKSYALLEIRRKTEIDLPSTIYVGGDTSDYQALDLVRENSGLAISFNGNDNAVRGCNIAVMSGDTTVISALVSEFYDGGIESTYTLLDNWTPAKLKKYSMPEDHPISVLARKYPKKLPRVVKVDRHNVDEIATESERFRDKLLC